MVTPDWLLVSLHYLYPVAVFFYFAASSTVAACTLQTAATAKHTRPKVIIYLLLSFVLLYAAQLVAQILEHFAGREWPSQDAIVGLLSCVLVFGIEQSTLGDASNVVWYPFYGSWFIAIVLEPVIAVLSILGWTHSLHSGQPRQRIFFWIDIVFIGARYIVLIAAVLVYFLGRPRLESDEVDDETSPLIPKHSQRAGNEDGSDSGYGTNSESNTQANNTETTNSPSDPESPWERRQRLAKEQMEKRLKSEGSWIAYAKGFLIFLPYIWPVKNRRLQLQAGLVGVCLLAGNALNLLIPRQMGIVLDTLSGVSDHNPWIQVLIFAALRLAASEAGIHLIRQMLWIPVEYYSQEAMTVAAYNHVMNLSSDFHDAKSSSDLLVAISHGTAVSRMLESICFEALPMMIDLIVAFVYLSILFGPYEGFITIATGMAFIQAATYLIARFKIQREKMVKTFFEEHYIRQAGIQGWHTVSAFNQIPYEQSRYQDAVKSQVASMQKLYTGYLIGHAFQYLILLSGLIAGAFLAVYQVQQGTRTAGDFVMLLTYWGQLTSPLRFFANLGKSISQDLVYAERLLEVMMTKPTIVDQPDAPPLHLKGGKVEFRDVNFSYDKKKDILKGVNLTVPSGKTAAFVGATGAGKSTILKLLDRFYDVNGGSILLDGQDIRNVLLSSLRQSIGIVPQAPILFDDTVMNNIRYARLTATDDEVYEACEAAAIHDHIMSFSDGYKTRVGERGIKISGGELQRIAIARAILKRPDIVLLDEATSSVDTETEQKIQDGLRVLCESRTTFIVAHRLSTVMNADIIFVVADGQIVEQGSHEELLERKGKYSELWSKQIFVKPKEAKEPPVIEEDAPIQLKQPQTDRAPTTSSNQNVGSALGKVTPVAKLNRQVTTPKIITSDLPANERSVETPKGHKKEGSKLNPGAPEFTPCSAAEKHDVQQSPKAKDWADDVEADDSLEPERAPFDIGHAALLAAPQGQSPRKIDQSALSREGECVKLYRHHHDQDSSRSVSEPGRQPPKSPSTPGTPTSEVVRAAMVHTSTPNIDAASKATEIPSSGRGRGRGRRIRGRHLPNRGRGERATSNPQRSTQSS